MKRSINYNKAMEMMNCLSLEERDAFIKEIMQALGEPMPKAGTNTADENHCNAIVAEAHPHRPNCPHCGAKADLGYIVKNGKHRGAQRFKCKNCDVQFVSTTNTAFARTRKKVETWYKFIEMTISGRSIAACAEECDICAQTAFDWRHKVLNAFVVNQSNIQMSGRVEIDDTFFSISYKGNHVKGSFGARARAHGEENNLPRKSFKRGTDNKSNVRQKACVLCMVQDKNRAFYAAVPGIGPANPAMLSETVGKHVVKDNVKLLSDNAKDTVAFFEANGYDYRTLSSNVSDNRHDHKPEIHGDEHIQHVNNFHHRLRDFMRGYCGVSTKYLENYTALFAWLANIKATKQRKTIESVSVARAATHDCYITRKEIHNRPAVPKIA